MQKNYQQLAPTVAQWPLEGYWESQNHTNYLPLGYGVTQRKRKEEENQDEKWYYTMGWIYTGGFMATDAFKWKSAWDDVFLQATWEHSHPNLLWNKNWNQ